MRVTRVHIKHAASCACMYMHGGRQEFTRNVKRFICTGLASQRDTNILLMDGYVVTMSVSTFNKEVQIIMLVYYFKVSSG